MEHEMMNHVPTSGPDTNDACGCTPPAGSKVSLLGTSNQPSEPLPTPVAAVDPPAARRPLKLVVTLTPIEGGAYRAAIALGADGCDPLLRSMTASGLAAALEAVPPLLEEAVAYWQAHPRNPTAGRAPARRAAIDRQETRSASASSATVEPSSEERVSERSDGDPTAPAPAEPVAMRERPAGGQLTLFG
ncbi:MAG: hypothetical protein IT305_10085 [Chloroflexi bacterium]|nr:hypothetical protein [Chloroflexota bacterium]